MENEEVPADTFPVRCLTALVATMPVPASPSGGQTGIPAFKWIFDKTVFKTYGLDSKIDPRNLKDSEIFKKIKQYAPTEEIKKNLEKAENKKRLFKNLAATKFAVSTVLAAVTYVGMTRLKQYYTEQKIRKNLINCLLYTSDAADE